MTTLSSGVEVVFGSDFESQGSSANDPSLNFKELYSPFRAALMLDQPNMLLKISGQDGEELRLESFKRMAGGKLQARGVVVFFREEGQWVTASVKTENLSPDRLNVLCEQISKVQTTAFKSLGKDTELKTPPVIEELGKVIKQHQDIILRLQGQRRQLLAEVQEWTTAAQTLELSESLAEDLAGRPLPARIAGVNQNLRSLRDELQEKEKQCADLIQEKRSLESRYLELQTQIQPLETMLSSSEQEKHALETKLAELQAALVQIGTQLKQEHDALEMLQRQKEGFQEENQALLQENSALIQAKEKAEAACAKSQGQQEQIILLKQAKSALESKIYEQDIEIRKLTQTIQQLKLYIARKDAATEGETRELSAAIETLQDERNHLVRGAQQAGKRAQAVQQELLSHIHSLGQENETMRSEIEALVDENAVLETTLLSHLRTAATDTEIESSSESESQSRSSTPPATETSSRPALSSETKATPTKKYGWMRVPNCAAIYADEAGMHVCLAKDFDNRSNSLTFSDLKQLSDWLEKEGVTTVGISEMPEGISRQELEALRQHLLIEYTPFFISEVEARP